MQNLFRQYVGIGVVPAVLLVLVLLGAGVTAGVLFPKFQAEAMLEFPERQRVTEKTSDAQKQAEALANANANVVELPLYKRVEAAYDSADQLRTWLEATGLSAQPAAQRLLKQAEDGKFWTTVSVPVLPFSKQDQKTYGDIKDASSTQLLGLQLKTDARTEATAAEMIGIMARYYTSAVVRERVRAWVVAGRVEAEGTAQTLRADIVKAELEIGLLTRRAEDMKAIIARHPDAARMDARQVVSVNAAEGGERYLSPLAQLVGAESAVSQQREEIRRLERKIAQRELLGKFYTGASQAIDATPEVSRLLPALKTLAEASFAGADAKQDWVREARLRVDGALDNFSAMQGQFGVRNGVRVEAVAMRDPLRLGALGAGLAIALLAGAAFLRASLRSMREERERGED